MKDYEAKIISTRKDLSHKEKIMLMDTTAATSLDELTQNAPEPVVIDVEDLAVLEIHNERSENKDYHLYIVVDKNGEKYKTSSEAFYRQLTMIMDEMEGSGEDWAIIPERRPSKNYAGRDFLTCRLV